MISRVCALVVGIVLVASACADGDTGSVAFTGGAASGRAAAAEAPRAGTSAAEAAAAGTGDAEAPDAGTAAAAPAGNTVPLTPRASGVVRNFLGYEFPPAPDIPTGPIEAAAVGILDDVWAGLQSGSFDAGLLAGLGDTGDPRLGWILSDLLRFFHFGDIHDRAVSAFQRLAGLRLDDDPVAERSRWQSVTDHLIAWDLPAFDAYADYKKRLLLLVDPGWAPLFADPDAEIDWRLLNWGGVRIDDRPLGAVGGCPHGCIPALDDPAVTDAAGGSWYPDDGIVFAVVIDGEARAYPRHIMEIHEMVNDTLGGRRIGVPYCTLCGSAQAFFIDDAGTGVGIPVLRTSGLLSRSNKVMYDLVTKSVFDTFTGEAVSGPLRERGVVLDQATVVTTTWGEWKAAHPGTTIVAEDGGVGRSYPLDPLRGRDDGGPIFPIGDADATLGVHDQVFGVVLADGTPVAFPVAAAAAVLEAGGHVELAGVALRLDGGGVRAADPAGNEIEGHQAFWFAWSQFMPDTLLWQP